MGIPRRLPITIRLQMPILHISNAEHIAIIRLAILRLVTRRRRTIGLPDTLSRTMPSPKRIGYRRKRVGGKLVRLHRWIVEQRDGTPLRDDQVVHHRDGNVQNNTPDNLEVMTIREHLKQHHRDNPEQKRGLRPGNSWTNRRANLWWHIDYTDLLTPLDNESWIEALSDHNNTRSRP